MRMSRFTYNIFVMFISAALLSSCASMSRYALKNNIKGVKKLLDKGEDINQYDKWGWTPLLWAVYYNYREMVEFMIENGADPNVKTKEEYNLAAGSTALHIAAYYEYGALVRYLLANGARTNVPNNKGETAFSLAQQYNYTSIMAMLDSKKAGNALRDQKSGSGDYGDESLQFSPGYHVVYLNNGKKVVGAIKSQDRKKVVMTVNNRTMTFPKEDILEIRYNR